MSVPGLAAYWQDISTRKHGFKCFRSYLENNTPAADRLFGAYGPEQGDITILAIEPDPEDQKRGVYQRLRLSALSSRSPKSAALSC
jgi:hypothetical protein